MPPIRSPLRKMSLTGAALAAATALSALGAGARAAPGHSGCRLPVFGPGTAYDPRIVPASFTPNVTNRWFPLTPGRVDVYTGVKDRKRALNLVAPTSRTKVIDGVRARIVEDRLYLNGRLEERTADYYAQDGCGNVWYFGEDTATLDRNGHVRSTEGSFHAGVNGAQPGVFMQARPRLRRRFRQEWYQGHAEDTFKTIGVSAQVTVPAGHFTGALRTEETTALEPEVVDNKLYVEGIGELVETAVKGPKEKLTLVEVVRLAR